MFPWVLSLIYCSFHATWVFLGEFAYFLLFIYLFKFHQAPFPCTIQLLHREEYNMAILLRDLQSGMYGDKEWQ